MRESKVPNKYNIYVDLPKAMVVVVIEDKELSLKNYKKVMKVSHWQKAMDSEYKVLIDNKNMKSYTF